jgi:ribosomal protein L12E/L44/L45/RPP1/RPP2
MKYAPFRRGVMRFEDYNYMNYNKYLLVDQQFGQKYQNNGYKNLSKLGSERGGLGLNESMDGAKLTLKNLNDSINEDFVFDAIGEQDNRVVTQGSAAVGNQEAPVQAPKAEDGEEEQDEQEGENSDGDGLNAFYDRDEIESTKQWQGENAFADLI